MHSSTRGLALTVVLIGATACLRTATSATDTGTDESSSTTMSSSTTSSDTTVSDTSETGQTSTDTSTGTDTGFPFLDTGYEEWGDLECDGFFQDCPEGEKCVAYASEADRLDANKCVPVLGDGQPGEPCTYAGIVEATDDCGPTSQCFNVVEVDGQSVGVCASCCEGTSDDPVCAPGTRCLIAFEGSINVCLASCDPLMQDCGPGLGCFFSGGGPFVCIVPTQNIPPGQPCEQINDCAVGLVCVPGSTLPNCAGRTCCASFCNVMQGALCPEMGTECVAFFEEGWAPPGYEDVGVCIVPDA
jgi:hypothetical protein